jgi:pre-rRNA-processing protein IPI1
VQGLNLAFCELTSILTLRHAEPSFYDPRPRNHKSKEKTVQKSNSAASLPLGRVSQYVSRLLAGEANAADGLSRPLPLAAYSALLPTLWSLVSNSGGSSGGGVGEEAVRVIADHAMRVGSTGVSKLATVEFVGRLILVR